ncbi:hypothetical protein [Sulfitobacter sediminilitoris]|uniref:hypothetical protein n=1 Tax=Sulfitobacter sediminilitoris TaxID=2698830 RepID=UPI002E2BA3F3|nr:hypothetical protein [Sulfitobacter sediminilitoris]
MVWSALNLPRIVHQGFVLRLKYLLGRKGVFGGRWDLNSKPFTEREEYALIEDLNQSLPQYQNSIWYQQGEKAVSSKGVFAHKTETAHSTKELDAVFSDYLVPLLTSMKQEGYQQRPGADLPEGMIGRDGALIKTAHGTHRLAAAKVTGASGVFPIKVIGVHRLWLARILERQDGAAPAVIEQALQSIQERYQ